MILGIEATHALKANRTGVEEYCWQLIQNLKSSVPSHVRVLLYVNNIENSDALLNNLPPNWEIKQLRWPFKKLWSQVRLSWELLVHPPDVFWAPGQLIPFFCPKKTVATVHDSAFLVYPSAYNFWGRQYLKWMNKRIVHSANLIITTTEFNRGELQRLYGGTIADVGVVPLAYDAVKFKDISSESVVTVLKKYSLQKPYIISVGRLETKKNIKRLVQAFNEVKRQGERFENLRLVLVGNPGVGYTEVLAEVAMSPYAADILRPGYVESADLPALLAGAEVFVFPSLYEGFGIPMLEAMAVGCPVVAARIDALLEVGGEAAVYANPLDAHDIAQKITGLLAGAGVAASRAAHSAAGKARAGDFDWKKTAENSWKLVAKKFLL